MTLGDLPAVFRGRRGTLLAAVVAAVASVAAPWGGGATVDAQSVPTVSIAGVVLTPSGQGANAAHLIASITTPAPAGGAMQIQPTLTTGVTASDGSFTLSFPLQTALAAVKVNMLNVDVTAFQAAPAGLLYGLHTVAYTATSTTLTQFVPGSISIQMQQTSVPSADLSFNTPCLSILCYASCPNSCEGCYGTYTTQASGSPTWAPTVITELHSWDGMSAEFDYKSSSESTVEGGYEAKGTSGWSSNGLMSVQNNTADTNIQQESNEWGYELAVPVEYEKDDEWLICSGGNELLNTRVYPIQSGNGFTVEANTSGWDGPDQYHANYNAPEMVNMLPNEQWQKDKSTTEEYSAAVTYFGFTAKSESVWSTQLSDHWSTTAALPYARNQDPYHLWGSNNLRPDDAPNIYASSGTDAVTGQGSLVNASFDYTNSIFSTSCAGSNTVTMTGTGQPLTLYGDLHQPVFTGTVSISASGNTNCTNLNNETGSFWLNSLTGPNVNCVSPYGPPSGSYTRAGASVRISAVQMSCTVNGVPTGTIDLAMQGQWKQNLDDTTGTISGSMTVS